MATARPNVLFFFADDQRFDTIHALGNPDIDTPNLDWLVRRGTAFTRAHIMGGTVPAVCMPSRAMLMTGRTLFRLQDAGAVIPEAHVMLPELLRDAGYDTFGTGKWHNGTASYARCFSHGDQIFFGGMDDHWNVPVCRFDPAGGYPEPRPHPFDPGTGTVQMNLKSYDHVAAGTHSSQLFADATIEFLLQRAGSGARARAGGAGCKPFFALPVVHGAARSSHHAAAVSHQVRPGSRRVAGCLPARPSFRHRLARPRRAAGELSAPPRPRSAATSPSTTP